MRSTLLGLLLAAVCAAGPATAAAAVPAAAADSAKNALIRRLLALTGAAELAVTALEASIPAQRSANPQVPGEFWDEFASRARRDLPEFMTQLVPIYDKHFTTAQLQQLVTFYESPLGRHLAREQPKIAMASMQAGQQWGMALGAAVAQDLIKRGVKFPGSP